MNCFNIRELQGILKRKFFVDLINSHDHRNLLEKSMINLKYKSNSNINLNSEINNFYNYGISNVSFFKKISLVNFVDTSNKNCQLSNFDLYILDTLNARVSLFRSYLDLLHSSVYSYFCFFKNINFNSFFNLSFNLSYFKILFSNCYFISYFLQKNINSVAEKNRNSIDYSSSDLIYKDSGLEFNYFSESTNSQRFVRFNNPLINYDYKTGHYIGNWESQYPYLVTSFIEVSRGIRKPNWFFSEQYTDLLKNNYVKYYNTFTEKINLKLASTND
jgi:hypothetical protein